MASHCMESNKRSCGPRYWKRLKPMPASIRSTTLLASFVALIAAVVAPSSAVAANPAAPPSCHRVVIEGEVQAGQGFEQAFTSELKFGLEALPSGWIVRVLPTHE